MALFQIKTDVRPSIEELDGLFQALGWRVRGQAKWDRVLSCSTCLTSAWKNDRLVGFARLLEDGVMCMVYDFGVHPSYQRQGIGGAIMEGLILFTRDKGFASIGLWAWSANPANFPFYKKVGVVPEPGGMELKKFMNPE